MRQNLKVRRGFRFGPLELDRDTGELYKDGEYNKRLRPQVLKLLVALLERPGEVLPKEELVRLLWGGREPEGGLKKIIGWLREDLDDTVDDPRYVDVLRGIGIRFIAPVETLSLPVAGAEKELPSQAVDRAHESAPAARPDTHDPITDIAEGFQLTAAQIISPVITEMDVPALVNLLNRLRPTDSQTDRGRMKEFYTKVVEPSYAQMKAIHEDYTHFLSTLRDHLRDRTFAPVQLVRWVRANGLKYRATRDELWSIDAELKSTAESAPGREDTGQQASAQSFRRYVHSILEYYQCTVSWHGSSFYRASESILESALGSITEPDHDIAAAFFSDHAVRELINDLSLVCDTRLPERWRAVSRSFRELRATVLGYE